MWRNWPEPAELVTFDLGAGFSRAVSDLMPLTDELGIAALATCGTACRHDSR